MNEALKLDNQLCFRLYTASRLITQAYYPYLTEIGLTYPQYLVMMVLWEQDGQPVNDIARRLYLETNTVTPLLKRMEAAGLLVREKESADGRKVIIRLTTRVCHGRGSVALGEIPEKPRKLETIDEWDRMVCVSFRHQIMLDTLEAARELMAPERPEETE